MSAAMFDIARQLAQRALAALGLAGVIGAGALLSTLTLLWWGYRLSHVAAVARTAGTVALRYGGVSAVVVGVVIAGGIHAGVIPGVNVDRLMHLVTVFVETVTPSGGGGLV
jgi:hypothetical protein